MERRSLFGPALVTVVMGVGWLWRVEARVQAWMIHGCCRGVNASAFFPSASSGVEAAHHVCRTAVPS